MENDALPRKAKEEFIEEKQYMRKEVKSIALGWNLRRFSECLAGNRDSIVQVLEFIDNLTATVNNIEEPTKRSTACSVIPERIDSKCASESGRRFLIMHKQKKNRQAKMYTTLRVQNKTGLPEIQKVYP